SASGNAGGQRWRRDAVAREGIVVATERTDFGRDLGAGRECRGGSAGRPVKGCAKRSPETGWHLEAALSEAARRRGVIRAGAARRVVVQPGSAREIEDSSQRKKLPDDAHRNRRGKLCADRRRAANWNAARFKLRCADVVVALGRRRHHYAGSFGTC